MKETRTNNSLKNKSVFHLDLAFVPILVVLSIIFILIPPFNQTFLRIIFALALLLFLPGYMFVAVIFPKRGELGPIERFTFSIGFSIAITVFDGFGLNYTVWGFRTDSITISLSIIIGILFLFTFIQRWRYGEESYGFSAADIMSFYNSLKNKQTETGPEHDPALEKILIKTVLIAILIVSAMLVYAKVTTAPERFTSLYILGANGSAQDYPNEVSVDEPSTILVVVENYEYEPVNYTLRVSLDRKTLTEDAIYLDHGKKSLKNIMFTPELTSFIAFAGSNKSKLEFQLLKNNKLYRSVHLLVNTNVESVEFADVPEIINGDMEANESWSFSANCPDITGDYNNLPNYSSRFYEINFDCENPQSFGKISQNFTTNGIARALLSFDVRDFSPVVSFYASKQALLDEKVIWESNIGTANNTWKHVELPVLLSGNNTISLRVYSKYRGDINATVLFDNIQLRSFIAEAKTNPAEKGHEFNFDVRGEPILLEKNIKINGFGFPGFKYDLNENRSYEELDIHFSENNTIGPGNATYKTIINGNDINFMGTPYRILNNDLYDNNLTINISRSDVPVEKTLPLGETWSVGDYSLSVKLISSKLDSTVLELKKGRRIVNTAIVKIGSKYNYSSKVGKNLTKVFSATVTSIDADNVYLSDILIYSKIIELKPGATYDNFKITNASSDELVLKNLYPIKLEDSAVILNGSLGFKLSGDKVYPYSTGIPLRGTPQYVTHDTWMNITGFNFPGFYLENETSFEKLDMYFTGDGFIETGRAVYKSKVHSNKITFLGNSYELVYPGRVGLISNITRDQEIKISENKTLSFNGYDFSYKNIDNNSVQLKIRKSMTRSEKKLLNRAVKSDLIIFPDVNYEIFTGKDNRLIKSNILNINESFEYREEYRTDWTYKKIGGGLLSIDNNSIKLRVKFYEIPIEIFPGKTYGDFDVYLIESDSIILKTNKPLRFKQGTEIPILGDALKIKTSSNEFLSYPVR